MIFALPKVDKDGVYAIHDTPQNRLGEYFCDNRDNRLWVYVYSYHDLKKGQALKSYEPLLKTSGLRSASAGTKKLNFSESLNLITTFESLDIPRHFNHEGYILVQVIPSSGPTQYGTIYAYSQHSCDVEWLTSDDGTLGTNLSADDDVNFLAPWRTESADEDKFVLGFAQRDIPAGKYFWALVKGIGLGLHASESGTNIQDAALWVTGQGGNLSTTRAGDENRPCGFCLVRDVGVGQSFPIYAAAFARIGIPPLHRQYQASYRPPS